MFSKVFIDANIFIDLNDNSRKSYKDSLKILKFLAKNRIDIYTSCDLITTIYYILAKKSRKNALNSIVELNKICQVIDFSNKEITKTCQLMTEDKLFVDLEDTLQYILAQKKNCDVIISNDRKFVSRDIDLMASTEFIGKYIS
jgi:predicted nucleic acid-binding protein